MDFALTEEQRILKDALHRFMEAEVAPIVAEFEAREEFAWHLFPKLREFGALGGILPEDAGGFGMSYGDLAVVMEEAGYFWHSLRSLLSTHNIMASLLHAHGTPEQKERFLRPLLACEKSFFLAITEPSHGSDVAGMETRAVDRGDHWEVTGRKMWITNGAAARAGILMARARDADGTDRGITAFLIDPDETEYAASRLRTMIIQASGTSELAFEAARVPKENMLGRVGEGLKAVLIGLNYGRLNVAMGAVGAAQAALDLSIAYAKERRQFGRPIGAFQLVQKMIVDMLAKTEAARALGFRAAWTLDRGLPARTECSIAKMFATEAAHEVASLALKVHGGLGYSKDYPIERIFRDTRGGVIPEGTAEIQTLITGREVLGLSAFS